MTAWLRRRDPQPCCEEFARLRAEVAHQGVLLRELHSLLRRRLQPTPPAHASPTADLAVTIQQVKEADYAELIERLRAAVCTLVPPGSPVLVVSRGDDTLLALGDRPASHFPQAADGGYAGYHPRDGAAAVAHLEALRARGARYLVLPATALWWLSHYGDFRRHLERTCRLVLRRDDTCVVFELSRSTSSLRSLVNYPIVDREASL
jgi:hypothetical protein